MSNSSILYIGILYIIPATVKGEFDFENCRKLQDRTYVISLNTIMMSSMRPMISLHYDAQDRGLP